MNKVEVYRKRAGLTQQEFAEKMGSKQSIISKVEKGKLDFSSRQWIKAAKILDCPIAVLIGAE